MVGGALKWFGGSLMVVGLMSVPFVVIRMTRAFEAAAQGNGAANASGLAAGIHGSLFVVAAGLSAFVLGLVLFVVGRMTGRGTEDAPAP